MAPGAAYLLDASPVQYRSYPSPSAERRRAHVYDERRTRGDLVVEQPETHVLALAHSDTGEREDPLRRADGVARGRSGAPRSPSPGRPRPGAELARPGPRALQRDRDRGSHPPRSRRPCPPSDGRLRRAGPEATSPHVTVAHDGRSAVAARVLGGAGSVTWRGRAPGGRPPRSGAPCRSPRAIATARSHRGRR